VIGTVFQIFTIFNFVFNFPSYILCFMETVIVETVIAIHYPTRPPPAAPAHPSARRPLLHRPSSSPAHHPLSRPSI
jgi:hypothetical protein